MDDTQDPLEKLEQLEDFDNRIARALPYAVLLKLIQPTFKVKANKKQMKIKQPEGEIKKGDSQIIRFGSSSYIWR